MGIIEEGHRPDGEIVLTSMTKPKHSAQAAEPGVEQLNISLWQKLSNSATALRLTALAVTLAVWQLIAMWAGPAWWPSVDATAVAMVQVFTEGYELTLLNSLQQMFIGFGITLIIGIPIGILMGRSRIADGILSPWVTNLFSSPKEALLPLLIILFGTDFEYRVSVVILFSVFFVVINTAAGIKYADAAMVDVAKSFCTPPVRMITRVLLPAASPFIVAGMRLGLGMALKAMIIAELWVSYGTGGLIDQIGEQRDLPMFAALAILVIAAAAIISQSLLMLENRLRRSTETAK